MCDLCFDNQCQSGGSILTVKRTEKGARGQMANERKQKGNGFRRKIPGQELQCLKDANVESCHGNDAGARFLLHVREGASCRLVVDVPRSTTSNQVTHLRSLTSFLKL